jgi:hypothetical protein
MLARWPRAVAQGLNDKYGMECRDEASVHRVRGTWNYSYARLTVEGVSGASGDHS